MADGCLPPPAQLNNASEMQAVSPNSSVTAPVSGITNGREGDQCIANHDNVYYKSPTVLYVLAAICLIFAICIIVLTVLLVNGQKSNPPPTTIKPPPPPTSWQQATAAETTKTSGQRQKCSKNWDPLPLLLISMDGFRADYLQRHKTPALQTLIDNGVHAPFMYSSYPTKTFPNHYTIITGLYPQSHGIVDNSMYDPTITPASDQYFIRGTKASLNPQWWKGEPFWNTVTKNGKKSAAYFWPGSEAKIQGQYPTYYKKYNKSIPFEARVEQIVHWLEMDDSHRPDFLALYIHQPDYYGHKFGPFSQQVTDELGVVDSLIDQLMTRVFNAGLFDCLNTVIISDHGMARVVRNLTLASYYPALANPNTTKIFSGPIGRIMVENGGLSPADIVDNLECQDPQFRVYARKDIPKRMHYTKSARIGDVIVDGDEGCVVARDKGYPKKGQHGFDYRFRSMRGLFLAYGPAFKRGYSTLPFQNVELYNLFADLLKLETRAQTDGTLSRLHHLTRDPSTPTSPSAKSFQSCSIDNAALSSCSPPAAACNQTNPYSTDKFCQISPALQVSELSGVLNGGCRAVMCPWQTIYDKQIMQSRVVSKRVYPGDRFSSVTGSACELVDVKFSSCANIKTNGDQLLLQNVSYYPLLNFHKQNYQTPLPNFYVKAAMINSFYSGVWTWLQALTATYAQKYGSVLVYSGPLFDYDLDDNVDSATLISDNSKSTAVPLATHFYTVLVRCDSVWNSNGACADQSSLHVLSFILPHKGSMTNCQNEQSYLFMHTARVADVQQLTGIVFFNDAGLWDPTHAIRLRTHVNDQLWI